MLYIREIWQISVPARMGKGKGRVRDTIASAGVSFWSFTKGERKGMWWSWKDVSRFCSSTACRVLHTYTPVASDYRPCKA